MKQHYVHFRLSIVVPLVDDVDVYDAVVVHGVVVVDAVVFDGAVVVDDVVVVLESMLQSLFSMSLMALDQIS